ncbi:MAG: 1-deoxy-D-xylulose-5-phosphate reductoisomerase [Desulfobacteraceae bacterium]|nr:MAG: 1-deoxy-D-xylulose-5-phosphate reductoisomerase [Desulfobacteraceae bacterium]
MKSLAVLGATGSIGKNTLRIAARFPEQFAIKVLSAKNNVKLLAEQIGMYHPQAAAVYDAFSAAELKKILPPRTKVEILHGSDGYRSAATWKGVDTVVGAMMGAAGLPPILAAIEAGKDIALANKETLVMAGAIVTQAVARKQVRLLPVDSEHSAIFQCIQGRRSQEVDRIILTASGGPFLRTPADQFEQIVPEQALRHPNWRMGAKITIDSATLMNKGLEVIEAKWLFDTPPERIDVVVHPQSIIHSMVAFCDGSIMGQMGIPDMQGAIAYALSFPERLKLGLPLPDLTAIGALTFEPPDLKRFACLRLAFEACRKGGTLPAVLNAANEVAVEAFLARRLRFPGIAGVVQDTMAAHHNDSDPDLSAIMAADAWARRTAQLRIEEMGVR